MAVFYDGNEGRLDGSEGCSMEVLGKFAFVTVLAEDSVCLVLVGALRWWLSGGAGPQWDVPQAIGAVPQAGDYDPVVFQYFHIKFGEDGDAVVIVELTHGY